LEFLPVPLKQMVVKFGGFWNAQKHERKVDVVSQ